MSYYCLCLNCSFVPFDFFRQRNDNDKLFCRGQIFMWFSILCDQDHKKKNTILFKIMEKYSVPNIPTTQGVLEDIFDEEIVPVKDHPIKLAEGNESLLNAHCCYKNFKQLQEDVMKQDGLNSKLDELNQKLVENIANMKQQT